MKKKAYNQERWNLKGLLKTHKGSEFEKILKSIDEEVKIFELGILPEFGHRKNVLVNLYIFSRNKIDLNLFSNIANGIVLEGFLEVRP